jgi:hypothetical protein
MDLKDRAPNVNPALDDFISKNKSLHFDLSLIAI